MMVNLVKTTPRAFWRLLALLLFLNLLDYAVTVFAFPRLGMSEANGLVAPWLHAPFGWPLLALKILLVAAVGGWAIASWRTAPDLVRAGLLFVNALLVLGMLWNGAAMASVIFHIAL